MFVQRIGMGFLATRFATRKPFLRNQEGISRMHSLPPPTPTGSPMARREDMKLLNSLSPRWDLAVSPQNRPQALGLCAGLLLPVGVSG